MPQVQSANTMMYGAVATPSSRKLMLRRGVLGLITVLVIFVSYESVTVARSVWYFQKGASLLRTPENIEEGTKDVVKAATLRPHALYFRTLSQVYQVVFTNVLQQKVTDANKATIEKALNDSFAQAVAYATKARDLEPENYVNWIVLGQTYQLSVPLKITGAYESAQYAYTEALRRNPLNPRIGLLLASLEVDRGNLEGARSYVLQTISMKPNYLDAYAFLTQIEVNLKNLPGAIQSQTLVTQINPTDPNAFFQLGLLQYYSQDFKGATASFEKTLSLASDYANAKYYLGLTYELTGNRPKAIDMFVDLAKTNPDNQEVQAILKSLQAGISPFSQANQNLSDKKQTVPIKTNR
jgi:tetratricopeptide (TPR) repeat protein